MNRITLKDCCAFQEGYVNPSQKIKDYFNGPIKWLRASDLNDGFVYNTEQTLSKKGFASAGKSAFLFNDNTIAISKSGTIGRLGILKDRMCGNRAVINIDVNMVFVYPFREQFSNNVIDFGAVRIVSESTCVRHHAGVNGLCTLFGYLLKISHSANQAKNQFTCG